MDGNINDMFSEALANWSNVPSKDDDVFDSIRKMEAMIKKQKEATNE